MGTELNGKSPGLAAKLSSPHYMDISPLPRTTSSPMLPPGSAMKEDTPIAGPSRRRLSSRPTSRPSSRPGSSSSNSRRSSSRSASPADLEPTKKATQQQGGSLGRLFGTCLSVNAADMRQDESFESGIDADNSFEALAPASKRRPTSLPMGQGKVPIRPSLRSAGLRTASASLMTSFASGEDNDGPRRRSSHDVLRALQPKSKRSSAPSLAAALAASRDSEPSAAAAFGAQCRERADNMGLGAIASHNTILESPSPGTFEKQDLGSYFFDPQSPETSFTAPPVKAKPSSAASSSAVPLRPRSFVKAHTQAALEPSAIFAKRKVDDRKLAHAPARPGLKAANKSASAVPDGSQRLTAPAPRRALSSYDNSAMLMPPSTSRESMIGGYPDDFDANGSPIAPASKRPSLLRRTSKDDTSPLPYGSRRGAANQSSGLSTVDDEMQGEGSSFGAECMPGFGASERSGKILPCFNVKEDGLMRITPDTLVALLQGQYNDQMESCQVVDCRFGYEYNGGHIPGAINLSTVDRVKQHFLTTSGKTAAQGSLPPRSQSGKPDKYGSLRKPILVFHCEFSAKRAPSMALALRQADRSLAQDYPNCHYPELYILQGGYSGFFGAFPSVCEPSAYVRMDDPSYQDRRSAELNGFRKQFARHRSFTYGDTTRGQGRGPAHGAAAAIMAPPVDPRPATRTLSSMICEEESSFEQESSPSNMAAVKKQLRGGPRGGHDDEDAEAAGGPSSLLTASSSIGDTSVDSMDSCGGGGLSGAAMLSMSPCAVVSAGSSRRAAAALEQRPTSLPLGVARKPFARAGTTGRFNSLGGRAA